jgi:methylglutaconyl-CoA hydratase
MSLVERMVEQGVMTITLSDEKRRNALSTQLMSEFIEALNEAENDESVRVVVVTNRGSVFCAGADLAERSQRSAPSEEVGTSLSELFERIRRSPLPFVGRLAGHCVAGGVGLAAVMDISVALDAATFGFSEVRIGVAPAIISVVCLPKMRRADALSSFLRGNRFGADEAARMGLITTSVSAENLDLEIAAIVNNLLAGEPHAIAKAKELTYLVPSLSSDEAFAWTSQLSAELFSSDEAKAGMAAFLDKHPAPWVRTFEKEAK